MAEEKKPRRRGRPKPQEPKKEEPKAKEAPKPAEKPAEAPKPEKAEAKAAEAPKPEKPSPGKKEKKPRRKKKGTKAEIARGKRKTSIARAVVREGSGRIRVNSMLSSSIPNRFARELIEEPLRLAGPEGSTVDVYVNVCGGGEMGQAQASRTAIAKALAQYFGEGLKKAYEEADKYLLNEDPRRVEPKKYKGRKARARFQKSYR